jgi:hypothetical protein
MATDQTIRKSGRDVAGLVLGSLAFLWIWLVSLGVYGVAWFVEQSLIVMDIYYPRWAWVAISAGHAVLLLIPVAPLALFWRAGRARHAFRIWAYAALFALCLVPGHWAHYNEEQLATVLRFGGMLLYLGLTWVIAGRRAEQPNRSGTPTLTSSALLVSAALAFPWLAWGALGSPVDTALDLALALLFGVAASLTIVRRLLPALADQEPVSGWDLFLAGGACNAALAIMAAALGFNGLQLLLIPAAGSVGWLAVLLSGAETDRGRSPWLPIALLISLSVAGPSLFVDPDELALVLNLETRDVLVWSLYATTATVGVAAVATLAVALLRARLRGPFARRLAYGGAAAAWLGGVALYLLVGQPGFYGDHLFVILSDQADLSSAAPIADHEARRQQVYETLVAHANSTQAPLRRVLDQIGVRYTSYYLVNALELRASPALELWLDRRPEVGRVLHNPVLRPLPAPPPFSSGSAALPGGPMWNQEAIGAPRVWQELGVTGEGVVIGQSDSGAQWDHPELVSAYRGGPGNFDYNWLDPWDHTTSPVDRNGHGTHTLGTAVGKNVGIAPGAEWYACVNLARNVGSPAHYLQCMQFMLAPYPLDGDPFTDGDPARGADVLNNSWGCPRLEGCDANTFLAATRALRTAGVFVVAAAGNEGDRCGSVSSPLALYDAVLSVGAFDRMGDLASFSSRGPVTVDGSGRVKPDLVAPGVRVLSAYPQSTYYVADGTSMASPHVVGVVALVWSANPDLIGDIDHTEQILTETAQPYNYAQEGTPRCGQQGTDPNDAVGYGIVDAYAAVQRALALKAP